jgi:hypothetical protein
VSGPLIYAGQVQQAGQGQAQLSQYYGYADTTQTTVTAASLANLSTVYSIPANEPYAGAAYELTCAGYGTWASSGPQALTLSPLLGSGTITGTARVIAAAAFSASAAFQWWTTIGITCSDGVSSWQGSMTGAVAETANALNPGTAADNSVALAGATSASYTAAVSSALSVALQAKWALTTGAPTLTCVRTTFRKVA